MKIKRILVSQPKPAGDKSPYYDIAKKYNVEVVFRPFIKTEGLTVKEFRQSKINLTDFTGVIFTSRAAIDNFFRICEELRIKIPDTMKYFCTTEAIALYLQKYIVYRKRKISFGVTGKLDDAALLAALDKNNAEVLLFPVSDVHKEDVSALESRGLNVTKAVMFRTVSNDFQPGEDLDYDMLLFFSPAGIDSLKKNFPDFKQNKEHIYLGAFGPTAVKAIEDADLRVDLAAPNEKHRSMTAALDAFLEEMNKNEKS
ncbi:MAG: uroporphyrinogen-III synthase [Muribaculaceae bacterium]|nr:uroporphyrinogen-III synthase [Muribaculaceae bacterium]